MLKCEKYKKLAMTENLMSVQFLQGSSHSFLGSLPEVQFYQLTKSFIQFDSEFFIKPTVREKEEQLT